MILLVVALIATIGGTLHGLSVDREEVIRHHAVIAGNAAQFLAEQARRSIHGTRRVLADMHRLVVARGGLSGLEIDRDSFELARLAYYLPDVGRLWVIDAKGKPVISSVRQADHPITDFNIAESEIYHDLAVKGMDWNIGRTSHSPYDGSAVFVVAQAMRDPGGALRAILLASVDVATFTSNYTMLDQRFEPLVGLFRADGAIIVRNPGIEGNIGGTIQDEWLFKRTAAGEIDPSVLESVSGYRHAQSPIDGVTRVYAYHRVPGLQLLVVTGITTPAALTEWQRRADRGAIIVLAISALLVALALAANASIRREELLTRRNALLATAVEAGPDAILITDANKPNHVLYFNQAFERLTGFSAPELMHQPITALNGPLTDSSALEQARCPAAQAPSPVEVVSYRKDGTTFLNRQHIAPVRDGKGHIFAHVAVIWDITDEREREREEHQRQRLESLGQLAGGIAHEINNLLQPIITLADLNLRDGALPTDERGRLVAADLADILSAARQGREVVGAVLAFARSDSAAPSPDLIVVADAVASALTLARNALPRQIRLIAMVEADQARAPITQTELTQVLMNLLTNASDAMAGRGTITVRLADQDDQLSLTVSDHGSGMDEEARRRAFDPFYTTKPVGRGTGMGLAVVHGVVRRWTGKILVESQPDAGTTITVVIPCHRATGQVAGT